MDNVSKMWIAFLDQQKVDPKEADKEADLSEEALLECQKKLQEELEAKLAASPPSLFKLLNLKTELAEGELNQKTESHPKLAGYDHSLEQARMKFKEPESKPREENYEVTDTTPPQETRGEMGIDWDSLGDALINLLG